MKLEQVLKVGERTNLHECLKALLLFDQKVLRIRDDHVEYLSYIDGVLCRFHIQEGIGDLYFLHPMGTWTLTPVDVYLEYIILDNDTLLTTE